ncbi:hypothetical protein GCM10011297_32590 [Bacterioplanes sanyensis]|nr:hypothetical protein GCM10011297_32590 [Bacterioplanes sanyensis]
MPMRKWGKLNLQRSTKVKLPSIRPQESSNVSITTVRIEGLPTHPIVMHQDHSVPFDKLYLSECAQTFLELDWIKRVNLVAARAVRKNGISTKTEELKI